LIVCVNLAEQHPECFVCWLLGKPSLKVEALKAELNVEPIRANLVVLLASLGGILHVEFQTKIASKPPLSLRMLDY
jgi:predicted transposase YdaD